MSDKKKNTEKQIKKFAVKTVADLVNSMKNSKSTKFSKGDFEALAHAILSDDTFKAKRLIFKAGEMITEEKDIRGAMKLFLEKLLKHAGMKNEDERKQIVDTFKFTEKDIKFVTDTVEEAMYMYVESGKNMRMFRDKALQLAIKKIPRTGKYEGRKTFKKSVKDMEFEMIKLKAKNK